MVSSKAGDPKERQKAMAAKPLRGPLSDSIKYDVGVPGRNGLPGSLEERLWKYTNQHSHSALAP